MLTEGGVKLSISGIIRKCDSPRRTSRRASNVSHKNTISATFDKGSNFSIYEIKVPITTGKIRSP